MFLSTHDEAAPMMAALELVKYHSLSEKKRRKVQIYSINDTHIIYALMLAVENVFLKIILMTFNKNDINEQLPAETKSALAFTQVFREEMEMWYLYNESLEEPIARMAPGCKLLSLCKHLLPYLDKVTAT